MATPNLPYQSYYDCFRCQLQPFQVGYIAAFLDNNIPGSYNYDRYSLNSFHSAYLCHVGINDRTKRFELQAKDIIRLTLKPNPDWADEEEQVTVYLRYKQEEKEKEANYSISFQRFVYFMCISLWAGCEPEGENGYWSCRPYDICISDDDENEHEIVVQNPIVALREFKELRRSDSIKTREQLILNSIEVIQKIR